MARVSIWREVGRRSRGILLTWRLVWKNPGKKKKPTLRISKYANEFHS